MGTERPMPNTLQQKLAAGQTAKLMSLRLSHHIDVVQMLKVVAKVVQMVRAKVAPVVQMVQAKVVKVALQEEVDLLGVRVIPMQRLKKKTNAPLIV